MVSYQEQFGLISLSATYLYIYFIFKVQFDYLQ